MEEGTEYRGDAAVNEVKDKLGHDVFDEFMRREGFEPTCEVSQSLFVAALKSAFALKKIVDELRTVFPNVEGTIKIGRNLSVSFKETESKEPLVIGDGMTL